MEEQREEPMVQRVEGDEQVQQEQGDQGEQVQQPDGGNQQSPTTPAPDTTPPESGENQ
jgi:hypothetical protein